MPETQSTTAPKIASAGLPSPAQTQSQEKGQPSPQGPQTPAAPASPAAPNQTTTNDNSAAAGAQAPVSGTDSTQQGGSGNAPSLDDITPEQLQAYFEKQGIKGFDGKIETLKSKFETAPAEPQLTEEQKQQLATDKELKLLKKHISRQGTNESLVELRRMLETDPTELAIQHQKLLLKQKGKTPEQIEKLISKWKLDMPQDQYDMLSDDEKKEYDEQRAIALDAFKETGATLQAQAKKYLESLEKDIQDEDDEQALLGQHASKVEAAIKAFPRKETIELGKHNEIQLDPVVFEYSDDVLNQVQEALRDPQKIQNQIFNEDGTFKVDFLLKHFVNDVSRGTLAKHALLEGSSRAVKEFEKRFSATPPPLGGMRSGETGKGKAAKAGEPQFMKNRQA